MGDGGGAGSDPGRLRELLAPSRRPPRACPRRLRADRHAHDRGTRPRRHDHHRGAGHDHDGGDGAAGDHGPRPAPGHAQSPAGTHAPAGPHAPARSARRSGNGWLAGSGARFDLRSNALRPDGWTSADAAGLPIFPGLVRYDEATAGAIRHALRFTVDRTQAGYIHPATHKAGVNDASLPPMGLRLRLKAGFDLTTFHGEARVVLEALRTYGMMVADNGSSWFITGATDTRWDDNDLNQLKTVPGAAFEVVQTGPIQH